MNTFSDRLQEMIKYRQVKQKDMANSLGITPSTLNGYVKGTREPDFQMVKQIAEYLNVTTDYLFNISKDELNKNILALIDGKNSDDIDATLSSIGLTENLLTAFAKNQIKLDDNVIDNLAGIFGVTRDYILGHDEESQAITKFKIPPEYADFGVAFSGGIDNLTQADIDVVISVIKQLQDKNKK